MAMLKKWFWLYDIRSGCNVICWLGLVFDVLLFIRGLVFLASLGVKEYHFDKSNVYEIASVTSSYLLFGFSFVDFLINSVLLWGMEKNKRFLLLPWIVSRVIFVIPLLLISLYIAIDTINSNGILDGFIILTLSLGLFAILIYSWCCVISLYQEISEDETLKRLQEKNRNCQIA